MHLSTWRILAFTAIMVILPYLGQWVHEYFRFPEGVVITSCVVAYLGLVASCVNEIIKGGNHA